MKTVVVVVLRLCCFYDGALVARRVDMPMVLVIVMIIMVTKLVWMIKKTSDMKPAKVVLIRTNQLTTKAYFADCHDDGGQV